MSQEPILPEENLETVKTPARRGRKPKAAKAEAGAEAGVTVEGAEAAPVSTADEAPKKPARRTRKPKAEAEEGAVAEAAPEVEASPKARRTRKTKAAEAEAAPAEEKAAPEADTPAEAPKARRGRPRKVKEAEAVETVEAAPAAAPAEAEAAAKEARKAVRRTRRTKAEEQEAEAEVKATAEVPAVAPAEVPASPVAEEVPATAAPAEKTARGRKARTAEELGAPDYDSELEDDGPVVHLGSAVLVEGMIPPAAVRESAEQDDEAENEGRNARRGRNDRRDRKDRRDRNNRRDRNERNDRRDRRAEPGNQASQAAPVVADDLGNRAAAPAPAVQDAQPEWFDDGVVTNILPYPGEFYGDIRNERRINNNNKKGRRNRDAQPAFNGSPYLPEQYQADFYGQPPFAVAEPAFGNRKDRRNKKNNRRGRDQVPTLPAEFDFSAAMMSDSILGTVLAPREDDFMNEDDGPQPVLSDQPVAQPLSMDDMDEEDFEALDAAVNGNRIGGPRIQQKEKGRKGKENARQDKKDKKAQKNAQARNAIRNEVRNELRNIEDDAQDKAVLDKAAQEAVTAEKKAEKKAKKSEAADAPKSKRTLYISVVPDEQAEVVITEDGLVTEYFVEMAHQVKIRGNIYKGVINNIDTNLQAAFVNFGSGKNGFLQIDEVHPEYYLVPHDASHGPKYPPIQKVLKVGQEVLVQVVKEPAGTKGAFLTTWISIAGRFLVLTPGQEQIGVSRKVEDPEERARLKELLNDIHPGENMGVIIRTASEGVNEASIQQDLQLLQKLWKDIQKKAPVEKTPSLIYQEADLATRSVRDYLSDDIEEIWTDDEATKARVEEIVSVIFPDRVHDMVKMHKDSRQTLWERFGLLKQLETVTSREVVLPSGGRLVFDQTEALMAIDINSGKTQGKTNFEAMVFRTNMEAAEAIARHLRLRDIGGQVVIDFIEMRDKSHCREVERTLRNAMHKDRARHDVGHMSSFGLLELVRQRTGTSAISITTEPCPHCHGTGVRRNMEWQALQAMRDMQAKLCKTLDNGKNKKNEQKADKVESAIFVYESDAELALYILNRKRDRIAALEEKYGVRIEVRLKG